MTDIEALIKELKSLEAVYFNPITYRQHINTIEQHIKKLETDRRELHSAIDGFKKQRDEQSELNLRLAENLDKVRVERDVYKNIVHLEIEAHGTEFTFEIADYKIMEALREAIKQMLKMEGKL